MSDFEELHVVLPDGYRAYGRYWPVPSPIGAVLYHHGIQSHCGWFEGSARRLAQTGFAVLQIDRRGSGRNAEDRGHAESCDQLLADHCAARDTLLNRSGCAGYHLLGVSWGGKLAAAAYAAHPQHVRSLTLITPGIYPIMTASPLERHRIGFAMLYEPRAMFPIPLNDADLFTQVPLWQDFFAHDADTLRQATAGFYLASRRMDQHVLRLAAAPGVPLHLVLAGDERIIHNDRTERFFRGLSWPDMRITCFTGARHSIEFLPQPEPYFAALAAFLQSVA